jgi:tetratricopeptide (TPR) repeat protein
LGRFSKLEVRPGAKAPGAGPGLSSEVGPPRDPASADAGRGPDYNVEGCMGLGDEAFFRGEEREALRWYSRAMKVDSTRLEPWVAQVRLMLFTRQLNEAKVWLNRALSIFPENPVLMSLHALKNALSGEIRQAMAASDRLMSQQSGGVDAWLSRAHILIIAEQHKNADFCFDQCLQLSPEADWKTPMMIGMVLDFEQHWAKSVRFYEAALARRAGLPYAWFRIGRARAAVGQRESARQAFLRAEALCGEDDGLRRKIQAADRGSIFARLGALFRKK